MGRVTLETLIRSQTIDYSGDRIRLPTNTRKAIVGGVGLGILGLIPGSQLLISVPLACYTGTKAYQALRDNYSCSSNGAVKGNSKNSSVSEDCDSIDDYLIRGSTVCSASRSGITSFGEYQGNLHEWLDSFDEGKVILVLGKRGSGKTSFAFKASEYVHADGNRTVYALGFPEDKAQLLPDWMYAISDLEKCRDGSFIVVDEAGLQYMAYNFHKPENLVMSRLLQIARHKGQSVIYTAQNSATVDKNIIRQADSIVFKQPGILQVKSDRPEVRRMAEDARDFFDENSIHVESLCYVQDDLYSGGVQYTLPSFWSDGLSKAWNGHSLR